ncbi:hypothetical protein K440DRAFT_641096 [Wilcoxina mikolae CBS 423.85]|nr:hypothetical protein K440DRAFT_641096 [Wilcoxina mikolae CBS 423.85]
MTNALSSSCQASSLSVLVYRLDGTKVNPANGGRYSHNKTYLLVANSLAGILAWKCTFILLEKSSLDLEQFNCVVSLRILWPLGIRSRWCSFKFVVTITLLVMLPSTLMTPLLSGAVDWTSVLVRVDAGKAITTMTILETDNWHWYQYDGTTQKKLVDRAVGIAGLVWSNIEQGDKQGCRHVVPQNENLPVNSTVLPQYIQDVLENPKNVSVTGDLFSAVYLGNSLMFNDSRRTAKQRNDFPAPVRFSGEKTVVVIVGNDVVESVENCTVHLGMESMFGIPKSTTGSQYMVMVASHYRCAVVGTINFTAGVIYSPESTYVSRGSIETRNIANNLIVADRWVAEAIYLMPDIMGKISLTNTTSLATWNNLDGYIKSLVRQSYIAA